MAYDDSACSHCRRMREELEEAREKLRQERENVATNNGWTLPYSIRLRPSGRRLLETLVNSSGIVGNERLTTAMRSGVSVLKDDPEDPASLLKAQMSRLRKDLIPLGIKITTVWGEGYVMDAESKRKAKMLGEQKERATEAAQKPQLTTEEVTL